MKTLNDRYNYGLNLILLSIDEGITGYRDDSLEVGIYQAGIYLFKFNSGSTRTICEICATVQLLTLNRFHTLLWFFHC